MRNTWMIDFKDIGDVDAGYLTPIEAMRDIPFEIKRIYCITRVPGEVARGFHSHRRLEQALICLSGSVNIRLKNPYEENVVTLDSPAKGLYVGHMVWREMFDFSEHAVLLVLASEYYGEDDYIRNYSEYLKEAESYFAKDYGR